MHIGQAEVATGVLDSQSQMIQSHQIAQRIMQIVHVYFVFDRCVSKLIGCCYRSARSNSAPDSQIVKPLGL